MKILTNNVLKNFEIGRFVFYNLQMRCHGGSTVPPKADDTDRQGAARKKQYSNLQIEALRFYRDYLKFAYSKEEPLRARISL